MNLIVREARESDVDSIIDLFSETGENTYNWEIEKWNYYYRDYPDGAPISLIAVINGVIVGHYGLQPVMINQVPAMMGLHAYIATSQRGLTVISALMKEVDRICISNGIKLICGFANKNFSVIKSTFFQWKTVCWLGFQRGLTIEDFALVKSKKFYFHHSDKWYLWRFGSQKKYYASLHVDHDKKEHIQLLKYCKNGPIFEESDLELWSPKSTFSQNQSSEFCQPFSLKIYDPDLISDGMLNYLNWSIDMGDSDTFKYAPTEKKYDQDS